MVLHVLRGVDIFYKRDETRIALLAFAQRRLGCQSSCRAYEKYFLDIL